MLRKAETADLNTLAFELEHAIRDVVEAPEAASRNTDKTEGNLTICFMRKLMAVRLSDAFQFQWKARQVVSEFHPCGFLTRMNFFVSEVSSE